MNTGSYDGSWALANDNTLTYAHASPCIASDDQYIFVIGGDAGTAAGSYTQYYDTVNDLWRQPQNAATGRARQSCAISGDKNTLYQFGGTFDGYSPVSISCGNSCSNIEISVEILDISNKATIDTISATNWELVYDGPSCCGNQYILGNLGNLLYSRAVTLDGYIYIIGGRDRYTNPTDTVTFFDPSRNDNQVQFSVDLNTARSSPAVVVADGSIYVFGGTVSGSSPYTSSWEKSNVLTDAPTPAVCNLPPIFIHI